ncbi:MAG: amidohydrolase family protein [Bryobacterales bacterium]|nr:amidohydrolase family protein [Bryobacterales bacterium]
MRILLAVWIACSSLALAAENSFLLRGATIHPVTAPAIPNGMLLVKDGIIAEVGAKIAPPRGVRVIEARGLHVYPGLIDSGTHLGLAEISSVRETVDTTEIGDFNPQLRAIIAVHPASEHIPVTRANGITTALTAPAGGIISGQAALIHLDGWTWEEMQVKAPVAMILQFPVIQTREGRPGAGRAARPFSEAKREYERRLQQLRDFFEQARRYQKAKLAGGPGFRTDHRMEAMLPVIEGRLPVLAVAVRERAIREAIAFAESQNIRLVLAEAREAYKVADLIKQKNIPVVLGPTLELPLEEDDPYDKAYTLPAELHRAGIKFAFASFSTSFARNLPYQAAMAVAFGLPYEEALKALTIYPAEIWGVADKLGSIEKGKWADLIVTDGDPLETRTQVKQVFIRGREADLSTRHLRLYEKYSRRP